MCPTLGHIPSFKKSRKKLFGIKSSKNTLELGYPAVLLFFWISKKLFLEIWCPVHSFICYCNNVLFLFDSLDDVPSLKFFLLMTTMLINFYAHNYMRTTMCSELYAHNFYVASNHTMSIYWSANRSRELVILTHM